jgi:serine/threonine protein phosphatase PrpC
LQVECAEITLKGSREDNQDRVAYRQNSGATLLVVCDGMGGHADGERAAEIAVTYLLQLFSQSVQPLMDPYGFLHIGLGNAHERVVQFGAAVPLEQRPRATCAAVLVQGDSAYFAHAGDSRIYHLRQGRVVDRTRDHSHVELLVREGVISAEQGVNHPMRNFVESCLGGEPMLPEMTISVRRSLSAGDVLLLCTDGFWSGLSDDAIAQEFATRERELAPALRLLSETAVRNNGAASDNTSAVALRVLS